MMDGKQDEDPVNLQFLKSEPKIESSLERENKHCPAQLQTFNDFESQITEQFSHIDEIKQEIIECEMPKIEQQWDLPSKIDHDNYENAQIFPIKQEFENTSVVSMKDICDIKQEISELLTSHCDLPTLKIENTDYPDYYGLEHSRRSSKLLQNSAKLILKKKMRRYACPICQKNFPSSKSRSTHIGGHFKKRCVVCQFCGKLMSKIEIFQHFFIHAVKNRTKHYINNKLSKCFLSSKELLPKNIDNLDDQGFNEKSDLQQHFVNHSSKNPFKSTLGKHLIITSDKKPFKCEICSKEFTYKSNLHRHLLIHSGEKPFKCGICSKGFNRKSQLDSHVSIHSGKKPFECEICSKEFTQKSHLQQHLIIHRGEKLYKCPICFKCFNLKFYLQRHLNIHSDQKQYKCDICFKEFTQKASLQKHLISHSGKKPFKCDICSKCFNEKSTLTRHSIIHSADKPFKCDICSKCFNEKSTLTRHSIIHSADKPFKCDICFKAFNRKFHLQQHLLIHSGEKSFKCPICYKCFNLKSQLQRHLRIHTNKKP